MVSEWRVVETAWRSQCARISSTSPEGPRTGVRTRVDLRGSCPTHPDPDINTVFIQASVGLFCVQLGRNESQRLVAECNLFKVAK